MRVDLFDLLEGLFKGIVFFIYNALETGFLLFRYPFRAPVYLSAAYRMKGRRQIGGTTFMFLALFVMLGLMNLIFGMQQQLTETASKVISSSRAMDMDTWWPTIVFSSTACFDFCFAFVEAAHEARRQISWDL